MENLRDKREKTIEKVYVSWNDVEQFIKFLADNTNNFKEFNGVYGPARGGVIYAVIISNRYNIPFLGAPQRGCICVDDICDSGNTALAWKEKGYIIATHYYKQGSKVLPNLFMNFKDDKWVVFPWEKQIEED